ncbi:MAG: N-formylglutamate amidohydrolase [Pseudomonadota bacterium]
MAADPAPQIASEKTFGDAPILIFCDHATNWMPDRFRCLGLPDDLLKTHIAWDIGAGALAEAIARKLKAQLVTCGFSRLIVDPNRDLASGDLIPAVSDQIPIPGNQMLDDEQRGARIKDFHEPYHQQLGRAVDALETRGPSPIAVSIHSYTNRLMGAGDERPWPVGMLWRWDEPAARSMIEWLERETDWPIGDNEPYDARLFNYSVDRHIAPRSLRHLTFEVRQDFVTEADGQERIATLLARGIGELQKAL